MQEHDRNIAVGDVVVDEPAYLFLSDAARNNTCHGKKLNTQGQDCSITNPLSKSPRKLLDYRKQRASVSPVDRLAFLLTPNRQATSLLRSFDDAERPSLSMSLEDSGASLSFTDPQSCLNESQSGSSSTEKIEFYLKVPKKQQTCQRSESLQSLVSKMHVSSNPKRSLFVLDPKVSSPRKLACRAGRRFSGDYYRDSIDITRNGANEHGYAGNRILDSDEERQARLKRLSGFCSARHLTLLEHSLTKMSETGSNSSETVKGIVEKDNEVSRAKEVQKLSRHPSMRNLKDDKRCSAEKFDGAWPEKCQDSYPIEIIVPLSDLSWSRSFGDREKTSTRNIKSRRSNTSNSSLSGSIRRSISSGESIDVQLRKSCSPHRTREVRRWSSSCDGRHDRANRSSRKIEMMIKTA
jgi:hypothetical protein